MKSYRPLGLSFVFMTVSANAAVMNYVITGSSVTNPEIYDTATAVPGAGDGTNSVLTAVNAFVDFTIGDADAIVGDKFLAANINALPTVATLRVTLTAISGSGTELMIARTSDSQGLTDIGTMTILLTGALGANSISQTNSGTFRFDWRNAANTAALTGSDQMVFTSYDLDFTQRNRISTSDYSVISTSTTPATVLTNTTSLGETAVFDGAPGTSSTVSNPANAYAFQTVAGDYSQSISVDKIGGGVVASGFGTTGNQLYMFSFRSPSPLIPSIPEPSSAVLVGLGALAMFRRRRA